MTVQDVFFDPTPKFEDQHQTRSQRKRNKRKGQAHNEGGIKEGYKPLTAQTDTQADYIDSLATATQIFGIGPAGTGKTYIPARMAAKRLKDGHIDKILIARPTVSQSRHQLGFLPGSPEKKLAPWLVPILDAIKDEVNGRMLERWMVEKRIEFLSFEHMRGRTFKDCWVILDEAQNCTFGDLKLFLTRKGENSVYAITGDTDQTDIGEASGLSTIVDMIEDMNLSPDIIAFDESDCVRSADAKEWVMAFSKRADD